MSVSRTRARTRPSLFDVAVVETAANELPRLDPDLRPLADALGPVRPPRRRPGGGLAFLARSVVYQQLAIPAARAIAGRLEDACGGPERIDPDSLSRLGFEGLRALGLSSSKARTVRVLAESVRSGRLSLLGLARRDDREVIERLSELPGIGPWTAEMFLIFHLGRVDVMPATDLALRHAVGDVCGDGSPWPPGALTQRGRIWSPYRSVVALWLWRWRSGRTPGLR